jgi:hypothetical protein
LIIFIDDLDRCKPDYTIKLLECIKHFFSVPGAVFVLAIDSDSLGASVRASYGDAIDTDNYLRKFIDWRYRLPKPRAKNFGSFLAEKFEFSSIADAGFAKEDLASAAIAFGKVAETLNLTLREQEQCFTELNLTLRSTRGARFPLETAIFAAYRIRHRSRLIDWFSGSVSAEQMAEIMISHLAGAELFHHSDDHQRNVIRAFFLDEKGANEINRRLSGNPKSDQGLRAPLEIYVEIQRLLRRNTSLAFELFHRLEGLNFSSDNFQ